MLTQYFPGAVHDRPRLRDLWAMVAQKAAIIAIRQKAQILTIVLGGNGQPKTRRQFTDVRLAIFAHREQYLRELLLTHDAQYVALILRVVQPFEQLKLAVLSPSHPRIVTRRQIVSVERQRIVQQPLEADMTVAFQTRI